jgi:peptidoglycan/xylan/chitin deacetylase (PgdA/CDA1 family)
LRVFYDAGQKFTMDVEENIRSAVEFSTLLDRHGLQGEFFACGCLVQKYGAVFRRIAENHILSGHGFRHENFARMNLEDQYEVITKTGSVFEENGIMMQGWRFPNLNFLSRSMEILARLGIYDSSLRTQAIGLWGPLLPLRNVAKNAILNHMLSRPTPFPEDLMERPFAVVDIEDECFYEYGGRIVTHCYNYPVFQERLKGHLENVYG